MEIIDYSIDANNNLIVNSADASVNIIGSAGLGYNAPKIVTVNGTKGFLKESDNTTKTFDKFEYLIAKLGKYLGVKTADEYLVKYGDRLSLFSQAVYNEGEKFLMSSDLSNEIINTSNIAHEVIEEAKHEKEEFDSTLEVVKTDRYTKLKASGSQIEYAIGTFIDKIEMLQASNEEEIVRNYIKMCFFDAVIGNKDRTANNFGIVKSGDHSYAFAPLFDSSTIAMPGIDSNYCQINDYLMDRQELLKYLLNTYPDYLDGVFDKDVDDIGEKMTVISKEILDEKEYQWFNEAVLSKLNNDVFEVLQTRSF